MHPIRAFRIRSVVEEIQSWGSFRKVLWHDTIDSTNRFARDALRDGSLNAPSLIVASHQTSGVGRGGNKWFSPDGCLMFTLVIPMPTNEHLLPLKTGITIAKAVEPLIRVPPKVKWPNDVYLGERKLGGILIEVIKAEYPVAIIGVGLNCQVDFSGATSDVRERAVSLHEHARLDDPEAYVPESVLIRILKGLDSISSTSTIDHETFQSEWNQYSLLDGRSLCIESGGERIEGICDGITPNGSLRLIDTDGHIQTIIAGTIISFT
jgi:BirA family transcriptional regulator, biotin operon repressor / biotin---[acetyl-CoA-carboxylase] ligase